MPQFTELDSPLALRLQEVLENFILEMTNPYGDLTIRIDKEKLHEIAKILRNDEKLKFEQMMDLTAVDYLHQKFSYRFQMVYHFYSLTFSHRVRIKCNLSEKDAQLPSIHDLWKCVNWYERECFDMYGIKFMGHPNLKRLIMYEEFEGHPLRKDYPIDKQQPRLPLLNIGERHKYLDRTDK